MFTRLLVVDSQSGPGERLDWQWTVGRYSYRDEEGLFDLTRSSVSLQRQARGGGAELEQSAENRLSAPALWLASSDKSGLVNFGLNLPSPSLSNPQVGVRYLYSADQSRLGQWYAASTAVTFGSGSF